MAIKIKTAEDIAGLRVAGRLASELLDYLTPFVKPGVTTGELDRLAYAHTPEEIKAKYWDKLCMEGRYPAHMAAVMGDQFYYAKFKTIEEGLAFDRFVREKAQAK